MDDQHKINDSSTGSPEDIGAQNSSPKSPGVMSSATIKIIAGLIALTLSFGLGFSLGLEYTMFKKDTEDKYLENFAKFWSQSHEGSEYKRHERAEFQNSRGQIGLIVDINGKHILISKADGSELIIEVAARAVIRKDKKKISITDLRPGNAIAVVGHPEEHEGVFEATLIRVIKPPPSLTDNAPKATTDRN